MRHVSDEMRRARIAVRHALAPPSRVGSAEQVTRAMTVLHATEASTVYLSCWARSQSLSLAQIEGALYGQRTIVRQLAMRRTLFVFPRDLLGAAWGSASARVAGTERQRMTREIVQSGVARNGEAWLEGVRAEVLSVLDAHPEGLPATALRKLVPGLQVKIAAKIPWSAGQLLIYLGARGDVIRGTRMGDWRSSRSCWTLTRHWLDGIPDCNAESVGYRELVSRWLRTFGPGTEDDIAWWLGATKGIVRAALATLRAVEVSLDNGRRGWLLPDDLDEVPASGSWVALLPTLDPTVMGWQSRDFFIGQHKERLFDRSGNVGTTLWVDGRVVGCWIQDGAGAVELRLLEQVSKRARRELESDASRLTAWIGGVRLNSALRFPAMIQGS